MHNLSRWRITLQSQWIKEAIRAAGPAAEILDNALQQLLNWRDGGKKILFPHHLKGKCNYLWTNQHLALTSCAWPCWTCNHGNVFVSAVELSFVKQRPLCLCEEMNATQPVLHVFLSPRRPAIQSHPALYDSSYWVQITNMQGGKSPAAPRANTQRPSQTFSTLKQMLFSWADQITTYKMVCVLCSFLCLLQKQCNFWKP